ncbi:MAG: serine/threonine protein kinase [Proteobacteria bacterium]|nr:serine/threonine protein kinase [Pseudomonadota bacterium]
MLAESLLFGASVVTSTATRVLLIGDVAPPRPAGGQTTLALVLVVVVAVFVALLARLAAQKKKTEEAAAKILSMSENMLSLSSLPISRSQIGTYTLKEKLAEGVGFISYRAVTQHGEACDLKIPTTSALEDKTAVGRLEREASVLEGIDSPHVVRFKAFEKLKDRGRVIPILVTEPVRGEELSSVIKRVGAMHPLDVISIMADIASALAAVHRNQNVHRNLKPQSVSVTENGRAILHNFGVVQADEAQQLTQRGDVLGTGLYMSPEQITGKTLDGRSDLYSLGVLAYEMLTGQPPHAGVPFGELVMRKMTQEAPHPGLVVPGIPSELDDLVSRLLSKESSGRPASAGYLITELSTLETNLSRERSDDEDAPRLHDM